MTNEELTVLAGLASEVLERRELMNGVRKRNYELCVENEEQEKEKKRLLDECNHLRESEANALNAAEEAKRERDEAREKLGEWIAFAYKTQIDLIKAYGEKNMKRLVLDITERGRGFFNEHKDESIEGGAAK